MQTFRIGDRVEYNQSETSDYYHKGQVCTVEEYCDCEATCGMIATDVTDHWHHQDEFKLVPKMTNAQRVAERRKTCLKKD